jgi:hypothetical protein
MHYTEFNNFIFKFVLAKYINIKDKIGRFFFFKKKKVRHMRKEPENIGLSAHACTLRHDLYLF